jgi:hypothetical protein
MQTKIQGSVIAAIVVAIGALMITSAGVAPAAYAHHSYHHHKVKVSQDVTQTNVCSASDCENHNHQDVTVSGHHSVYVRQHVDQLNVCDKDASCINDNTQTVHVS